MFHCSSPATSRSADCRGKGCPPVFKCLVFRCAQPQLCSPVRRRTKLRLHVLVQAAAAGAHTDAFFAQEVSLYFVRNCCAVWLSADASPVFLYLATPAQ